MGHRQLKSISNGAGVRHFFFLALVLSTSCAKSIKSTSRVIAANECSENCDDFTSKTLGLAEYDCRGDLVEAVYYHKSTSTEILLTVDYSGDYSNLNCAIINPTEEITATCTCAVNSCYLNIVRLSTPYCSYDEYNNLHSLAALLELRVSEKVGDLESNGTLQLDFQNLGCDDITGEALPEVPTYESPGEHL